VHARVCAHVRVHTDERKVDASLSTSPPSTPLRTPMAAAVTLKSPKTTPLAKDSSDLVCACVGEACACLLRDCGAQAMYNTVSPRTPVISRDS
jgi:hypothetical protein